MMQWHRQRWRLRPMVAAAMAVVVVNCTAAVDATATIPSLAFGRTAGQRLPPGGMQSGRSRRYFGDNRNLLAPSNKGHLGGRQARGTADTDSCRNNHHINLEMVIVLN